MIKRRKVRSSKKKRAKRIQFNLSRLYHVCLHPLTARCCVFIHIFPILHTRPPTKVPSTLLTCVKRSKLLRIVWSKITAEMASAAASADKIILFPFFHFSFTSFSIVDAFVSILSTFSLTEYNSVWAQRNEVAFKLWILRLPTCTTPHERRRVWLKNTKQILVDTWKHDIVYNENWRSGVANGKGAPHSLHDLYGKSYMLYWIKITIFMGSKDLCMHKMIQQWIRDYFECLDCCYDLKHLCRVFFSLLHH